MCGLNLEREGPIVTGFISSNGTDFTSIGNFNIGTSDLLLGLYQSNFSNISANAVMKIVNGSTGYTVNYGAFAFDQLLLGDRAKIYGANTGSNGYIELGFDDTITGNAISGGSILMKDRSKINGDATSATTISRQNGTVITGTITTNAAVNHVSLPEKNVTVSGRDTTIHNNQTVTLDPGIYGDIHAYSNSTLILRSGTYSCGAFILEPDAHVQLESQSGVVEIDVSDNLSVGDRCTVGSSTNSPGQITLYSNQNSTVSIGYNTYITGCIIAPHGTVEIKCTKASDGSARFRGYVHARVVDIKNDVYIDASGAF